MADLGRQGFTLPSTLRVVTGRADGGKHWYFRLPSGVVIHTDQNGRIAPHIDVRGDGGYVVTPPSIHKTGAQYRFIDPDAELADLPAWAIDRLKARASMCEAGPQAGPKPIGPGQRTPVLFSMAGKLRDHGVSQEGILGALRGLNATFAPPHDEKKLLAIARGVERYPAGVPPGALVPDLLCLANVEALPVHWMWKGYLAFGMLAMLSGDPDAGRTFIALAIAADLSNGRLPVSKESCTPLSTLYLSRENAPEFVIRPRFDALGGDSSRFHLLRGSVEGTGKPLSGLALL
jgi:hypothetical protein